MMSAASGHQEINVLLSIFHKIILSWQKTVLSDLIWVEGIQVYCAKRTIVAFFTGTTITHLLKPRCK